MALLTKLWVSSLSLPMRPPQPLLRLLPPISRSGFDSVVFIPSFKHPLGPGPGLILNQLLLSGWVHKGTHKLWPVAQAVMRGGTSESP